MDINTKYFNVLIAALILSSMFITGCIKDLDTLPLDPDVFASEKVYSDFDNYEKVLAKLYAGLSLTGQKGPDGNADLRGLDEGFSQYLREYWYAQELPTDEAVLGWGDASLALLAKMNFSPSNEFTTVMYSRIFYQIALCNEFIRESSDAKLTEHGFDETQKTTIGLYRAEARFLRAFSYYHALDLFGNVPFVTEEDGVGAFLPEQILRADLFDYVEGELLDIENVLMAPQTNVYGRVDRASDWMLLARLYLNAEVYGKTAKYTETITYAKKVIDTKAANWGRL